MRVRRGWTRCARRTASGRRRADAVVDGGGDRVKMGVRATRAPPRPRPDWSGAGRGKSVLIVKGGGEGFVDGGAAILKPI